MHNIDNFDTGHCKDCGDSGFFGVDIDTTCSPLSFPNSPIIPTHDAPRFDPNPDADDWMLKQRLASPARYYGGNGTIHSTGLVNVEIDKNGKVVSVWFRCCMLPFDQTIVEKSRADEMRRAYAEGKIPSLVGVEILDKE